MQNTKYYNFIILNLFNFLHVLLKISIQYLVIKNPYYIFYMSLFNNRHIGNLQQNYVMIIHQKYITKINSNKFSNSV